MTVLEAVSGVVHEYLSIDLQLVMKALDNLEPVARFIEIVAEIESNRLPDQI